MLKRKEWQLFQGQDGSGSQSDEDSVCELLPGQGFSLLGEDNHRVKHALNAAEVEEDSEDEQGSSEERGGDSSEGGTATLSQLIIERVFTRNLEASYRNR